MKQQYGYFKGPGVEEHLDGKFDDTINRPLLIHFLLGRCRTDRLTKLKTKEIQKNIRKKVNVIEKRIDTLKAADVLSSYITSPAVKQKAIAWLDNFIGSLPKVHSVTSPPVPLSTRRSRKTKPKPFFPGKDMRVLEEHKVEKSFSEPESG